MLLRSLILTCFLATGCTDGNIFSGNSDDIVNPDETSGDNIKGGVTLPSNDPAETLDDNLSSGSTIALDWASTSVVACWPATENVNFDGAHVFHQFDQARGQDFYLRAAPDDGVDISVYYLQYPKGEGVKPPDYNSGIFDCDAQYADVSDSNAGQAEVLFVQNHVDFDLIVGIAGAAGATSGGYTLEVYTADGTVFPQE